MVFGAVRGEDLIILRCRYLGRRKDFVGFVTYVVAVDIVALTST